MPAGISTAELERIRVRLAHYRDHPTDTKGVPDSDLESLHKYLVRPENSSSASLHWFCSKAEDPAVTETATFLLRLHAYNGGRVIEWRKQLRTCLGCCCDCVRGLQENRLSSRDTYFGAFPDNLLDRFYKTFDDELVKFIVETCEANQLLHDKPSTNSKTLADIPLPVFYLMFSNMAILQHPKVLGLLRNHVPATRVIGWPTDAPAIGLLLLLMEQTPALRAWAMLQVNACTKRPMAIERFTTLHDELLRLATDTITNPPSSSNSPFFSSDSLDLWQGYSAMLRFVPAEWLYPSKASRMDIRQFVIGHLADTGKHFTEVLKSFLVILDRLGATTWKDEGDEFPQVVFNTIKDNLSYAEALQALPADKDRWAIQWMEAYVKAISDLPAFSSTVPLIIQFLCEELQHERYQDVRSSGILVASRLLLSVLFDSKAATAERSLSLASVWDSLDIHANIFVSVAFGRAHDGPVWTEARASARELVKAVLKHDITNIHLTIANLSKAHGRAVSTRKTKQPLVNVPVPLLPPIRTQLWRRTYESILPNDACGITTVLEVLALIAHMDNPNEKAFEAVFPDSHFIKLKAALHTVSSALDTIRSGFEDAVSRYVDLANSGAVLELLGQPGMAKKIMIMMFSPLSSIREPVQALAGLAMDVESRIDCFRALMLNFPGASFDGMTDILNTFIKFAPKVVEACSLSKSLALCFTDIIDVLCANPDGLIHKSNFLRAMGEPGPAVVLPKWWALMSEALAAIFRYTVGWANYCDTQDMITWMRDALIFGRDMLAQRKIIETGALALSMRSSGSHATTRIGSKMVQNLQPVLLHLTGWLKLTDEELLYQAFSLLQPLLGSFKETQVDPAPDILAKLNRYAAADQAEQKHKLDRSRVNALRDMLSVFDDEVQIIEHVIPEPEVTAKKSDGTKQKARLEQQKLTSMAAKSKKLEQDMAPQKLGRELTTAEQRKLDSASVQPKFSRATAAPSVASSSKPQLAKQHKPQPTSISSDSSDSSSEDEGADALIELAKKHAAPKKPEERRQVKMLDAPMTGKYQRVLQRNSGMDESRRTALRLKPDISSLHRRILSWNYDHDGSHPPGEPLKLFRVPDEFTHARHYRDVFDPLLLLECWAQIQQSKEADEGKFEVRIVGRQYADCWVDLDVVFNEGVAKDWNLTETDIVLLRHPATKNCRLLKVQQFKQIPTGLSATLRMFSNAGDPGPQVDSLWMLNKVFSLTTLHREYGALMAMEYYDMVRTILKPALPKSPAIDQSELAKVMETYILNEPQARAILSALQTDGFSLIQGPPGTGKTSTICGLVQLFLSKRKGPVTFINVGQNPVPPQKEIPKKILLCAPSNAAIDEITFRLKEGVSGAGQRSTSIKVVRVGNPKVMNSSVKDVSLDSLTEQKLNINSDAKAVTKDSSSEISRLRSELENTKRLRQQKEEELNNIRDNTAKTMALDTEIQALRQKVRGLANTLDKLRDQQKGNYRTMDALSRRCRAEVLQEADVICATLAGSGHEALESLEFEMVIIDEAAQAIELSSLIPLKYRCNRCVMVGDPQQLPPTVISQEASKYGYNQSLFVRLQKHRPDAVHLLSIQYRMHPEISVLPSRVFYNGRLQDGPDMASKTRKPWHTSNKFGPYHFYNVAQGVEETGRFHSLKNRAEAQVAVALYSRLRQEFSSYDFDFKVGVVTMYRAQVSELRQSFEKKFGSNITSVIDFNTVDGFQGQEKDIIILSCVRAGPGLTNVGFLADVRRMNVALTRAKSSVFILGNAATLERSDQNWKTIVQDARERSALVDANVSFFTTPGGMSANSKPAKAPKKENRAKPRAPAAPPAEDLIALGRSSPAKPIPPPPESAKTDDEAMDVLPAAQPPVIGQKRSAEDTLVPPPSPAVRAQQHPPQGTAPPPKPAKPPVARKPKPPRSIFITRNPPPKPPPPAGRTAGPSR